MTELQAVAHGQRVLAVDLTLEPLLAEHGSEANFHFHV
jgi:hypothetical protein